MKRDYISIARNVASTYDGFKFHVEEHTPHGDLGWDDNGKHCNACWVNFYVEGDDIIGMTHKNDLNDLFMNWLQRWYNAKVDKQMSFKEFLDHFSKPKTHC